MDSEVRAGRTIAALWRRAAAGIVDALLLGLLGAALGLVFFTPLSRLAAAGHLVGFSIALIYAGLFESRWGGGSMPGKRLLGLRVVDRDGALLAPWRAFLRAGIFSALLLCTGLAWFFDRRAPVIDVALNDLGMLLTAAILWLFLFNVRTRQSLHDLAAGSYVVHDRSVPTPTGVPRPALIATSMCVLALLGLFGTGLWRTATATPDPQQDAAIAALESRPDVAHAHVFISHAVGEPETAILWAWMAAPILDQNSVAASIAATVRERSPSLLQGRQVRVRLIRSVTLGFFFYTGVNQVVDLPRDGPA
jgi:uncharacterized RDD family membrane protein YckC